MFHRIFCLGLVLLPLVSLAADPKPLKLSFDPTATAKKYITANCNDPAKLEFVETGKPFSLAGCVYFVPGTYDDLDEDAKALGIGWADVTTKGAGVRVKYRTANALGAKILQEHVFVIDLKGKVVSVHAVGDFLLKRPPKKTDPALDAFGRQFDKP